MDTSSAGAAQTMGETYVHECDTMITGDSTSQNQSLHSKGHAQADNIPKKHKIHSTLDYISNLHCNQQKCTLKIIFSIYSQKQIAGIKVKLQEKKIGNKLYFMY